MRRKIDALAALGMSKEIVGKIVGLSTPTVRKYYGEIFDVAEHRAHAMLAESLYIQAVGRDAVYDTKGNLVRAEVARVPSVGIFLAKVKLGYKQPEIAKSVDDRDIKITVEGGLPRKPFNG
jgi:hypothetical protein